MTYLVQQPGKASGVGWIVGKYLRTRIRDGDDIVADV